MKVAVVGGSLAGLMAAVALADDGHDVEILERSTSTLRERGAGLRLQPNLTTWLEQHGVDLGSVTTHSRKLRHVRSDGTITFEGERPGRISSWGTLHRALRDLARDIPYRRGSPVSGVTQDDAGVALTVPSAAVRRADVVVFCDGISSLGRSLIDPGATLRYAGYVAWRGSVPESQISPGALALIDDATVHTFAPGSHAGVYLIPGTDNATQQGFRRVNWVWYRTVAAGVQFDDLVRARDGTRQPISMYTHQIRPQHLGELRTAADALPPGVAEIVRATEEPFIQTVYDCEPSRIVAGRGCLLGDAAFVARPHAGAATSRANVEALALAQQLGAAADVTEALDRWQDRILPLGQAVVRKARLIGEHYLGDLAWEPGDPALQVGLPSAGAGDRTSDER